ncbi:SDR family NAD(P)-dependent oxidoreductase [Nostoc punctiforme]|jgi:short-subunit dehydrogenase|uniref:Short-chain dehydrogenase/reductase SDR n=1 Tax=Nostoc punctiforme (strain ATCC 29133 / PCC 73102) TaxID=63737 RepID=B2J021_NOSP7|nr:SDR family NAD(P)-dependent oxidoreductase [Nostoc punctiforme]ACC81792.1 short-chain dehydrogenase/reductase SDR [Nostoc punctiforme PCC 73102]
MKWPEKYGEWAIVTGASSGIGRAFAHDLAQRGMNLILVARQLAGLEEVAAECNSWETKTYLCAVDLTEPNGIHKLISLVGDREVGILVNNVGIVARGLFTKIELQRQLDMVTLHCTVPVALTHHYLAQMLKRNQGAIINISSVAAYHFQPLLTTYAATKEFDWKFSKSLAWELKDTDIDILTVVPGFTKTAAYEAADWKIDFDSIPALFKPQNPREVSKKSLDILGKQRSIIVASFMEKLIINANYLLPDRFMEFILSKMFV